MPDETLLAFDYGTKFIGVALGNTLTRQARPLETFANASREARFGRIQALIEEWRPARLVVGLALTAEGGEQFMSQQCRRFANQLHGRFNLPVELVDERGTTMAAEAELAHQAGPLERGQRVDAVAAAIILQSFFDSIPHPHG